MSTTFPDFVDDPALAPTEPQMVSGDGDGSTMSQFFPRSGWTVMKILAHLELMPEYRLSYMRARGEKRRGYKDSGEWSHWRDDNGALTIRVDVGCYHEHDCCGCLCALLYEIQVMNSFIVVLTHRSYNY